METIKKDKGEKGKKKWEVKLSKGFKESLAKLNLSPKEMDRILDAINDINSGKIDPSKGKKIEGTEIGYIDI